jgi:nitroreductase/dihydropteridine reductase
MNSIESLQWRYATKKFDSQKSLDKSQLEVLAQAFNLTATSYGLQPCRLVIVQDQDLKDKMVPLSYGQLQVKDASAVLVICTTAVDANYVKDYFSIVKKERNTPDEVIQPFQDFLTNTFSKKEVVETEQWAKNQAYLILGNLLTVCAQQQIDSCPMEGFVPEEIDQLLGLQEKGLKSTLLLPVGYRSDDDAMSQLKKVRRPQQEMVSFV